MGGTMKAKERTRKRGMMNPSRSVKLLLMGAIISYSFVLKEMQGKYCHTQLSVKGTSKKLVCG